MRLIVLSVMGLLAALGLAVAIVSLPVMAEKGPLRDTLVAHLGGAQEEEVTGEGDPDGQGRAVVRVFEEQLCGRVETAAIETSSSKATIHLGMSGEKGPIVATLQERAATPTTGTTTGTTDTTATTGTTTGTRGTTGTTGTTTGAMGTTTPTTDITTTTTGTTTGAQAGTTTTTTTGDTTLAPATPPAQSTTVAQTSPSQSTASPTASASTASPSASPSASASASASTASPSATPILEHTGGCVAVPRALSLELLEHPRRYYVNVTNGQYPEGAIRGQLQRSGDGDHRSGDNDDD